VFISVSCYQIDPLCYKDAMIPVCGIGKLMILSVTLMETIRSTFFLVFARFLTGEILKLNCGANMGQILKSNNTKKELTQILHDNHLFLFGARGRN
jgi:hypothetical protein